MMRLIITTLGEAFVLIMLFAAASSLPSEGDAT